MWRYAFALIGLVACAPAAGAFDFSPLRSEAPITLIQAQGGMDSRTIDMQRQHRPDRYVCVVQPRPSDNRNRPYVCRANEGRVGGTCRCDNVVGTGRLDLDD